MRFKLLESNMLTGALLFACIFLAGLLACSPVCVQT
jgi:hypothetical protein